MSILPHCLRKFVYNDLRYFYPASLSQKMYSIVLLSFPCFTVSDNLIFCSWVFTLSHCLRNCVLFSLSESVFCSSYVSTLLSHCLRKFDLLFLGMFTLPHCLRNVFYCSLVSTLPHFPRKFVLLILDMSGSSLSFWGNFWWWSWACLPYQTAWNFLYCS